jgi:hypothetical protein
MFDFGSPFEKYNKSIFLEAEDDNNQQQDDTANDQPDAPADNADTGDNNAEPTDSDFDIDTTDDTATDDNMDAGGGEDNTDNNNNDSSNNSGGSEAAVDTPAKKRDREIFDSLSAEEQKLKTVKLKELFMKLYARCGQIIEKYDSLGVRYEDLTEPIKNSVNALYSLKDTISSYLLYLFDSKTYLENDIMFNRFLVAMNQIKLITKDMRDSHKEEIDAVKSNTPLNDKDIEKEKSTPNTNND